jgi:choline dehydrogenase-like flavoprotein
MHGGAALVKPRDVFYDIIIIGSGMGGGTLLHGLRNSNKRILVVERGRFIPSEPENWSAEAVFVEDRYHADDWWQDAKGRSYRPGVTYAVGGNTKVYGASLPRFRSSDFGEVALAEGVSPAWPITYEEMEPYYGLAEEIYGVHGEPEQGLGDRRERPFPFPPVPHEPVVQAISDRLTKAGYHPSYLPLGIDLGPSGKCLRCATCDGFVCKVNAKADADVRCVQPATTQPNVEVVTSAYARRIFTDRTDQRAESVELVCDGETVQVRGDVIVLSCGAVNSAALLLRSANSSHPNGLANSSDQVGRNYMVHNNTIMLSVNPRKRNRVVFQKTLYVNDFYDHGTSDYPHPLGHIQLIGKVREPMIRAQARYAPRPARRFVTDRSVDWWIFTEDLPDPNNRVRVLDSGSIEVNWKPNNVGAHEVLVREAKRMARAAGYPITLTKRAGVEICSHQAGTARAGTDPSTSVLDPTCRTHDIENLYVVDSSFFPSLPVMNPAMTIAANALRVSSRILEDQFGIAQWG